MKVPPRPNEKISPKALAAVRLQCPHLPSPTPHNQRQHQHERGRSRTEALSHWPPSILQLIQPVETRTFRLSQHPRAGHQQEHESKSLSSHATTPNLNGEYVRRKNGPAAIMNFLLGWKPRRPLFIVPKPLVLHRFSVQDRCVSSHFHWVRCCGRVHVASAVNRVRSPCFQACALGVGSAALSKPARSVKTVQQRW